MGFGVYINFLNETKSAIEFYEKVFDTERETMMTYEEMGHPKGGEYDLLVLNAAMTIHGVKVLFSDLDGHGFEHTVGNNITLVINYEDEALMTKEFEAMSEGGTITAKLAETFWAKKYGMVVDKFGIGWQFNLAAEI